jgi:hypothetical protein
VAYDIWGLLYKHTSLRDLSKENAARYQENKAKSEDIDQQETNNDIF